MDDLICELPPGYLAAVYETMLEWLNDDRFRRLPERLEEIGWSLEQVSEAAQRYAAAHDHLVATNEDLYTRDNPTEIDPRAAVPEEHAHLASWLLLGELGSRNKSYEFHLDVKEKTDSRRLTTQGHIISWILGRPILAWNLPPAVPALNHPDDAVMAAWQGLLHHLRQLAEDPTPEIPITAVIWRICALVDGMFESQNEYRGLENKIGNARARMNFALSPGEQNVVASLVNGMVGKRNVLTHLRAENGITFRSAVDAYREFSSIVDHVQGVTVTIFHAIAEEHVDTRISQGVVRNVEATLPDFTTAF